MKKKSPSKVTEKLCGKPAPKIFTARDVYALGASNTEVSLRWQFSPNEDDFEDVTFMVMNCDNKQKAKERVAAFLDMISREVDYRKNKP